MNLTPHLGIGDLLLIKMKQVSNNLNIERININSDLIKYYCENYDVKITFLISFITLLFGDILLYVNNSPINFNIMDQYKLTTTYLYDFINMKTINVNNNYSNYIIFHTKMRHDNLIKKFVIEMFDDLKNFFKNFKTSKKIILLGEKNIGKNLETKTHITFSLYESLLNLGKNNQLIDLTSDILTCGNPDFNKFLLDIEIINKSLCNITFGIGGPYSICKAFSKNNISFIPYYKLSPYSETLLEFNALDNSIVETISDLNNKIYSFTGEN